MKKKSKVLLDEVRQNFASVVWTHKIQEKQADIYASRYKRFKTASIIIDGITACGAITIFFCDEYLTKFLTVLISTGAFMLNTYLKNFDLKKLETQHRFAANKFVIVRNQLLHIIAKLHLDFKLKQTILEYEQVITTLNQLYHDAPSTTDIAVEKAYKALRLKDEYTYTDEEIDHFLPNHLKGGLK